MIEGVKNEVSYRTSRSSGAGGQHVNKVSTKVELMFNVADSKFLTDEEKEIISRKLRNRISKDGLLLMHCDETRSQLKNKEIVLKRFFALIKDSLIPEKERKQTKPTKSSKEKRLSDKRKVSEKKDNRKTKTDD